MKPYISAILIVVLAAGCATLLNLFDSWAGATDSIIRLRAIGCMKIATSLIFLGSIISVLMWTLTQGEAQ